MEKESRHPGLVATSGTVLALSPPTLQALGAHRVGARALQWAGQFHPLACLSGLGIPGDGLGCQLVAGGGLALAPFLFCL